MSAINYAISKIRQEIPAPILEQSFFALQNHRTRIPITLETRIQDEVVQKMVLPDINVIGGTTIFIPLDMCRIIEQINQYTVFHIPPQATDNRQITSVLEMVTPGTGIGNGMYVGGGNSSQIGSAASQQLQSMKTMTPMTEGRTMLLNSNTVMIEGPYYHSPSCMLKAVVGHDNGLSSIDHRNYLAFAELVVLATKAYIYTLNLVSMNEGYIQGGAQLGVYKDVIDSYSDALDMYHERLKTKWAIVDKLNDHVTRHALVTLMVGRAM